MNALTSSTPTIRSLLNLGLTAGNLDLLDGAERMFAFLSRNGPNIRAGYNNLGAYSVTSAIDGRHRSRCAARSTECPISHAGNSLATCYRGKGGRRELISIARRSGSIQNLPASSHNLGYAYTHLGQLDKALDAMCGASARAQRNEKRESLIRRSICQSEGRLREGFKEYEIRHDANPAPGCLDAIHQGAAAGPVKDLKGKRILIVGGRASGTS